MSDAVADIDAELRTAEADDPCGQRGEALQYAWEARVGALRRLREAAKFKAFVHSYLTQHGIPEDDLSSERRAPRVLVRQLTV